MKETPLKKIKLNPDLKLFKMGIKIVVIFIILFNSLFFYFDMFSKFFLIFCIGILLYFAKVSHFSINNQHIYIYPSFFLFKYYKLSKKMKSKIKFQNINIVEISYDHINLFQGNLLLIGLKKNTMKLNNWKFLVNILKDNCDKFDYKITDIRDKEKV